MQRDIIQLKDDMLELKDGMREILARLPQQGG